MCFESDYLTAMASVVAAGTVHSPTRLASNGYTGKSTVPRHGQRTFGSMSIDTVTKYVRSSMTFTGELSTAGIE